MIKFLPILAALGIAVIFSSCGPKVAAIDGPVRIVSSGSDFEQMVVKSAEPVVVDFWATWCPPCRKMSPVISATAKRYEGSLGVAKVDVDQNQDLAASFKIESIPTFMIFHQGKVVAQLVGGMSEEKFDQWVRDQLAAAGVNLPVVPL